MDVSAAASGRIPRWLTVVTAGLLAGLAVLYGGLVVFSRPLSLDEGYLMITVQGFLEGHPLYDSVFTQYGPLYYFHEWVCHRLFAVPLTHDATRWLCVAHWLTAAGLAGAATGRLARSALAGLLVFAQAVVHLSPLANEPGHPQELVALLLGAGLFIATGGGNENRKLLLLGAVAAALAFTKINVGIFFGFALLLALLCQGSERLKTGPWRWLLAGAGATLPFALMRRHLDAEWCRNYALIMACAGTATALLAGRGAAARGNAWNTCLKAAAVMGAAAAGLLLVTLGTGSSLRGVLDGLLLTPLRMPGMALLPWTVPNPAVASAAGAVVAAVWIRRLPDGSTRRNCIAGLKAAFALAGTMGLCGDARLQLAWLLPWVWLVVMEGEETRTGEPFARALLALAAAWQGLQAYPIAGTQVTAATLMLVPAYGVCLADAMRAMALSRHLGARFSFAKPQRILLAQGLVACALVFLFAERWGKIGEVRRHYESLSELGLPGSSRVRLDGETTKMYRELSSFLASECDSFVTYPGIHSLYFWSGKRPPTQLNCTGWGQLSHAQQEQILGTLRRSRRPLIVVVAAAADGWTQGAPELIRPLVRFVQEDCREAGRLGRFIIFEPNPQQELTQGR